MQLTGSIKVVEEVERLIVSCAHCHRYKPNILDDVKSGLSTRRYVVDTNPSLAVVKMTFDYRGDVGEIFIKDDKIWKLAKAVPDIIKPMCELSPFYRHKWISKDELAKIWSEKQMEKVSV